jgi:two-component system chemotaxis response regulator CheY
MPGLGGIELLENINNSSVHKNIPLIIHSGYEDAIKRKQCLDLGAFAYLVKPFEPEFLVAEVERALKFGSERVLVK